VHDGASGFDQLDRRQETRALQAVLVQLDRRGVRTGHEHHAFGEQAIEQSRRAASRRRCR
jgi:hypothetical protein